MLEKTINSWEWHFYNHDMFSQDREDWSYDFYKYVDSLPMSEVLNWLRHFDDT